MAKDFDPMTKFINGSVLEMPFSDEKFDAIYCFNFRGTQIFFCKMANLYLKDTYREPFVIHENI